MEDELQAVPQILLRRRSARQNHVHPFTHVVDHKGKTVFEKNLPADPDEFLFAIKPFRKNIVVGCECMFAWYWLADLCEDQKIPGQMFRS